MRTTLRQTMLAAAVAASLCAAGAAQAASTEIYGKVETLLRYVHTNGGADSLVLENGGSRWGMRIREDLQPGLSVRGYLEGGFNSDDGGLTNTGGGNSSSMIFDRRAILAIRSDTYGEIGFGRSGSVRSTISPYSLGIAWLDPFETGYGADSSISTIFGNDPRGNNTINYVSPKISGLRAGLTYSFATSGTENESERMNNRLLSGAMMYENGPVLISLGATQQWTPRTTNAVTGEKIAPEDAQAYHLGGTYAITDAWKLFLAVQYQKGWRSVAGWSANQWTYTDGTESGTITQHGGVEGVSALAGFQWKITPELRMLFSYMYFDGEQEVETSATERSKIEGTRHIGTVGLEYQMTKRTRFELTYSYSNAEDGMEQMSDSLGKLSRSIARCGIQHWF